MSRSSSLIILALVLALAPAGFAQSAGTINGTITDPSGAAVPDTLVTVKNVNTGLTQTVRTGADGIYNVLYLPVGTYTVSAEKEGFQKVEDARVSVEVNMVAIRNMQLQVGSVQQTIEVTSVAPLLSAQGSNIGLTMSSRVVQDLPLTTSTGLRSNSAFVQLMPGVVGSASNPRISGGLSTGQSVQLDGAEGQSEHRNQATGILAGTSIEAVEEFKAQSGAYSAEYGRTSNAILNFVTKSGTNELHGSAFVFNRNEFFNARGFTFQPTVRPVRRQWNPGGAIGGPLSIPGVIDGRNKAFFFISYEKADFTSGRSTALITVPVEEYHIGDMRRYVDSSGKMIPLYDPFDANGNIIQDPFARPRLQCRGVLNVICPERIDPIAKLNMALVPLPDFPDKITQNRHSDTVSTNKSWTVSGKFDYILSEKSRVNLLYARYYTPGSSSTSSMQGVPRSGYQQEYMMPYYRVNHDYIIRPNLLSHLTIGVNLRQMYENPGNSNQVPADWAKATFIPGVLTPLRPGKSSQYITEFVTFGTISESDDRRRTVNIKEQLAWIKGPHSVKFGFDYLKWHYRRLDMNWAMGGVSYTRAATGNPGVSGTTGSAHASFLLGLVDSGQFLYPPDMDFSAPYVAWYVQDDFKVNSKLTLNIGLRYEIPFAKTEFSKRTSGLNMTLPNPGAGGIPGAMEFTGKGPGRNGKDRFQETRFNALGPRFGIAYQPTSRTVLRAGGSIYYLPNREEGNANNGVQGWGGYFTLPANYFGTGIATLTSKGFQPFAAGIEANKPPTVDPALQLYGSPYYWFPPAGRVGYFGDWQFTIEHSLSPNSLIRLAHHANRGIRLPNMTQVLNQLDPKYWPIYGNLLGRRVDDPAVIASGFKLPYAGYPSNRQLQQALRPFPQYGNISINAGSVNDGHMTFNDLEASFERRFSGGLYVLAAYTFSKLISNTDDEIGTGTGIQNQYNRALDKAVSGDDRPHVLSISTVYEVPVGRGKALLSRMPRAVNFVFGNWKISAIQRYTSGAAMAISSSQNLFGAGGTPRASFAYPAQPLVNPEWNSSPEVAWNVPYLNKAAFRRPANMEYGNTPPRIAQLRGPKTINEDIAILKSFHLDERRYFEFRASAFNALNRHLLAGPDTNMDSSNFGKITTAQSSSPREIQLGLRFRF